MIAASAQVQPPPALAPLYGTYLVGLGSALAANLVIRLGAEAGWLPVWGQVAVGVAGVLPLILAAWTFWKLSAATSMRCFSASFSREWHSGWSCMCRSPRCI